MNVSTLVPRANTRRRDTYLNVTQHREEHVLERAVGREHHHCDNDKHRVQQRALERHRHVSEVERALLRPHRVRDVPSVHPETSRDEAGHADVHRAREGPVPDPRHLDGVGAILCARLGAIGEPGE